MTNQKKAYFFAGLTVLCWSTVATAFKIALTEQNYSNLLFFSTFVATISLLIIYIFLNKNRPLIDRNSLLSSALMGFLNPFAYYLVLFKAYSILPAQTALVLNYSWAIVIVILSIIFLKQKIKLINFIGLVISFFGVFIIATKGKINSIEIGDAFGIFLASGSSLIWGAYWVLNMKDKRNEIEKLLMNFIFGLFFISIYIAINETLEIPDFKILLADTYIGLFEMGLTFVFWLNALKYSETTAKVSNIVYLSPFLSLFFIAIMLGEKIEFYSIFGLSMIIFGILIPNIKILINKFNT